MRRLPYIVNPCANHTIMKNDESLATRPTPLRQSNFTQWYSRHAFLISFQYHVLLFLWGTSDASAPKLGAGLKDYPCNAQSCTYSAEKCSRVMVGSTILPRDI